MGNPDKIRISVGTASKLGFKKIKMNVQTTNCHLLTYSPNGCDANCAFCPQSKYTFDHCQDLPDSKKYLSRVIWPEYSLSNLLSTLKNKFPKFSMENDGFQRICLQSLNYAGFEDEVKYILQEIKKVTDIPISVTIPPIPGSSLINFKKIGVERMCFAIDSPTRELFDTIKGEKNSGFYQWDEYIRLLKESVNIFGRGFVSTHLIVGLGESEFEAFNFIKTMKELGITTGLFPFFPIKHTKFENKERFSINNFRKMQLGKFLIDTGRKKIEDFKFNDSDEITTFNISREELLKIIEISAPFQTSGCPGCNRPYYTSSPSEEQYNYPRPLSINEKNTVFDELESFCIK